MLGRLGKDKPKIIYDNGVWAGVSFDFSPLQTTHRAKICIWVSCIPKKRSEN